MGEGFLNKKDKLTLLMPREIDTFGLWIEQLVAESTGKENCGGRIRVCGYAVGAGFGDTAGRTNFYALETVSK